MLRQGYIVHLKNNYYCLHVEMSYKIHLNVCLSGVEYRMSRAQVKVIAKVQQRTLVFQSTVTFSSALRSDKHYASPITHRTMFTH